MASLPRGTVTLLFTDIEGSTQLLRRLGDAYADVLAEHQRLLRAAFAAHGGREVDTQGDAFFVAFPRAVDAVEAAVEAQRALVTYPWPEGGAVRVRLGLHTGEPTAAGGRYVGLAVHRAARVGSAAHGGQVLVSGATEAVLRDRLPPDVVLRDLGEHRLKDFDAPERLYQVVADGLAQDFPPLKVADPAPPLPLPVPLALEDTPLVGRDREQALLREHLGAALAGRGGLVLIGGEAGMGKTSLAEALGRDALDRGARVAVGRCYDLTETPPYGPWREALGAVPASSDLPALPQALGGPERGEAVAGQEALFARAHASLAAVAGQRPLVLLLDDLHWADPASLDLLRFMARQVTSLPLLLLVTYRADELTRRHPLSPLLPLLVREARAATLDLRALVDDAVRALARARYALPEAAETRLVGYLRERAEGHPLFVGELLRTLEEEGALRPADGGWALADLGGVRVPRLLRQTIEARLARLGEGDQRLLAVAAVLGQEVPLALWGAVAETDEEVLLDVVERAAGARLAEEAEDGARVRFLHALIREALYEGVTPSRRRRWHRRAGEALAARPRPDPDAVASHFQRAGDARAVEWLGAASERAYRAYAWLTAAERLEAALALLEAAGGEADERGWLLARLMRLRRHDDQRRALAYADQAHRLAAEGGDPGLTAYSLLHRGLLRCRTGVLRAGLVDLQAGVAAQEALPPEARARLAARRAALGDPLEEHHDRDTLAAWLTVPGRYAEAAALVERLLAGTPTRGSCYPAALAAAALGRPAEARRHFAEARAEAAAEYWHVGERAFEELLDVQLPYYADRPGERARVAREGEEGWRRAGGVGQADAAPRLAWLPVMVVEGAWAEARELALAVRAGGGVNVDYARRLLGPLAVARGEHELARELVRAVLPDGPASEPGDAWFTPAVALQRVAARLALDAGDLPTARAWLEAHDRWLAWSGAVLGRAEGQLEWAAYHRAAGDAATAREAAEQALAYATEPRQPLALLAAHRLLGELDAADRHAGAQAHLAAALALAAACAAPYERALTLVALAELRAAEGSPGEAGAFLDEARGLLVSLEARAALARVDALAARLATPTVPAPTARLFGLTEREAEVLRLAAQGLTSPQIADRLFVTRRTVGAHLTAIYTKLGVEGRAAAIRVALEHGL